MSLLNVNTIEPSTGTDITLGASGDTITVPAGATFTQSGTMNASAITAGTLAVARGGTGAATFAAAGLTNTPSFYAYINANQTIVNATETKITLNTEGWDTDSAFASNKFTVPSGEGGKYLFNFCVATDLAIDTYAYTFIKVNGSEVIRSKQASVKPNATGTIVLNSSSIVSLSAADYVELFIFQNSGSAQLAYANYCSLMGCKLIGV